MERAGSGRWPDGGFGGGSLLLGLGAWLLVAGCGDATSEDAAPSAPLTGVRDSAGVTIVEHGRIDLAAVPEWRLAEEPEVEIGRVDGDQQYLLHEVRDALRLDDGTVVAIVGSQLRAFDADGVHLWSQGDEGDGPGMYAGALVLARVRGDSIVVWDERLRRFSVLSREGAFARVVSLRGMRYPTLRGGAMGPDALTIWDVWAETPEDPMRFTSRSQWLQPAAVDLDGEVIRSWGPWVRWTGYLYGVAADPPWSGDVFTAPARDGIGLWVGNSRDPASEIRLLNVEEGAERVVRWQADRAVTGEDRDEYRRWYMADAQEIDDPERRRRYESMLDRMPWPDRFPAYDRLITDRAGRIWVAEYLREDRVEDDDLQRWTIFSADGTEVVGRFDAPQRFEGVVLKDVGDDWMLLVERDELDVERVRLYRIERG